MVRQLKVRIVPMGDERWACIKGPFDVEEAFGSKARVAVKGNVNGFRFRSSIFPDGEVPHLRKNRGGSGTSVS